jgi:uncharacterized protein
MKTQPTLTPVSNNERIDVMDILRGFALLGILLVNMGVFSFPFVAAFTGTPRGTSPLDTAANFAIQWLATGKFYPLFSFLFGLGMTLQMARIAERGGKPGQFMVKRLFWLMVFGLVHALLIWNGDILFIYALTGFLFVLFRNTPPNTLRVWIVVLFAIPVVFSLAGVVSSLALGGMSGANASAGMAEFNTFMTDLQRRTIETYSRGTWGEIFVWRAVEWLVSLIFAAFGTGLHVLALFLLGMYFGKRGYFTHLREHLPLFQRGARMGLGIGLPANFLMALLAQTTGFNYTSPAASLWPVLLLVFGPVLTFGYISTFVLLTQNERWRKRFAPLAAAGRMAFSNYIMQSIVCTFIFYSFGLGLFGQVGAFAGLLLSIAIWLVQLPLSLLWQSRFRFGPLEWLWRTLTYGRAQPMTTSLTPSTEVSA